MNDAINQDPKIQQDLTNVLQYLVTLVCDIVEKYLRIVGIEEGGH